jgi:phage-related minor tail protein
VSEPLSAYDKALLVIRDYERDVKARDAELTALRAQVAAAEQRAQEAERERDEWKERAALEAKRHLHHSQEHDAETWNTQKVLRETKADLAAARAQVGRLREEMEAIVNGYASTYTDKALITHRVCVFCGGLDGKCENYCVKCDIRAALTPTAAEAGERWRAMEAVCDLAAAVREAELSTRDATGPELAALGAFIDGKRDDLYAALDRLADALDAKGAGE